MNEITEIAATILAGLLASSDYTVSGDYFPQTETGGGKSRYRPEVVDDAIALAKALIEKTKGLEATPTQPVAAS